MFGKTKRRLRLIILASRRMRQRYRGRMAKMEHGWRARMARHDAALMKEKDILADAMQKWARIHWERPAGGTLGIRLQIDERMLMSLQRETFHYDEREYFRVVAQQIAHMVEREIATMNFAALSGHVEAARRHEHEQRTSSLRW